MITVKLWREINTFDPLNGGKDFDLDGTVDIIARVRNKTKEEVEEMPMEELLPEFLKCVQEVNALVFKKINQMPKNGSGDGQNK